jgi:hypothetical protein
LEIPAIRGVPLQKPFDRASRKGKDARFGPFKGQSLRTERLRPSSSYSPQGQSRGMSGESPIPPDRKRTIRFRPDRTHEPGKVPGNRPDSERSRFRRRFLNARRPRSPPARGIAIMESRVGKASPQRAAKPPLRRLPRAGDSAGAFRRLGGRRIDEKNGAFVEASHQSKNTMSTGGRRRRASSLRAVSEFRAVLPRRLSTPSN